MWIEIRQYVDESTERSVTPFAGVWIEILLDMLKDKDVKCHSLRGSVD